MFSTYPENAACSNRELRHEMITGFQLIESLLSLQANGATCKQSAMELRAARYRVKSLSLVYRLLEDSSVSPDEVDMNDYFSWFVNNVCTDVTPKVFLDKRTGSLRLPRRQARACGLLVAELLLSARTPDPTEHMTEGVHVSISRHSETIEIILRGHQLNTVSSSDQGLTRWDIVEGLLEELSGRIFTNIHAEDSWTVRFVRTNERMATPTQQEPRPASATQLSLSFCL